MTIIVAVTSLFVSLLLLIVHYQNQIERRHGEIAKLRSDYLRRFSAMHHRSLSTQLHLETLRLELRRMRDCEHKYQLIEGMPSIIERSKLIHQRLQQVRNMYDFDTAKRNKTKVLIALQSVEHHFHKLEECFEEHEQDILNILEEIRTEQEDAGGPDGGK